MASVLEHLAALVAVDTTNPPRCPAAMTEVTSYCGEVLASSGFEVVHTDLGDGCRLLLATRGVSPILINCHLDTVPVCAGWTSPPHDLTIQEGHAVALGACDVKGSAAALLTAAQSSDAPAAILFSTDEEAGKSRCVRTFVERGLPYEGVVVCEPTSCAAVSAHRGLVSVQVEFEGSSSHASGVSPRNAVHDAIQFCAAALDLHASEFPEARFTIGRIEGGIKPNMVAASAHVRFGLRPAIGDETNEQLALIKSLIGESGTWTERFRGPELAPTPGAVDLAGVLGVPTADPVDFWTEASLFFDAGIPAVVFGPGSIEHAHAPNESVEISALTMAVKAFERLFSGALV